MEDNQTPTWRHQINLVDRETLSIEGVIVLGSFDEHEISMETQLGMLQIKGDGLNIKELNLERGHILAEGSVKAIIYDDSAKLKKGLLERLLK